MSDLLKRLQSSFPVRLVMEYGNSQAGNYAAVVAFNAFMTMFPLILGALTIIGYVVSSQQGAVESSIVNFFPASHDQVRSALHGLHNNAGLFGILSIAGLLWTGTNFFSSLEFALDQVYGEKTRGLIPQRLMGLGMLLAFVVAMLLSVGASTLTGFLSFVPFIGFVVGALVMMALLILIYWVVPNRRQHWADVWPGAVVCGVLIEVLTLVWPVYARLMHGFNTYGQTFGLFFLLATWLYFMSALMLLGAVFNKMRLGGHPVPEAQGAPARAAAEDADGRGVQVEAARRRRPQT